MTKSEITKRIKELRKAGFLVFTFSTNKYLPKSLAGLPDYLLINRKRVVFIELKLEKTKDKLSEKQNEIRERLINYGFEYYLVNEKNLNEILNLIL